MVTFPRVILYCRHGSKTRDLTPGKLDVYLVPKRHPSILQLGQCVLAPCFPAGTWEGTMQRYRHTTSDLLLSLSVASGGSYLFSYRPILSLFAFVSVKTWQALFTLKGKTEISGLCLSPGRTQLSATGSGPKCWFSVLIPSCARC